MKLSKVSASRRLLFIPIALFALATIIGQSLVAPASAAPTKQECWDQLNNKPYEYSRQTIDKQNLINSCKSAGFCTVSSSDLATNTTTLSCANPSSLGSTTVGKTDAEVKPLVTLVCGNIPTSDRLMDTYVQCGDNVRKIYSSCNYTGGSITSNMQDTVANSSKCVYGKLSNPKPSASAVTDAVQAGRNAANNIVDGAIADQAKKELQAKCDERAKAGENVEWNGTECAPKADSKTTCAVDGIGWIICPVMTFLGGVMDAIQSFLADHFLSTNPELVKADPSNGTFQAWGIFRNYANLAFIGVFLFIIYSQMTGAGLSNYGLKRMLPRLIVAAILVNLSFYICMVAVDLSNILGYGVKGIFDGVTTAAAGTSGSTPSWATAIAGVLITGLGVALALAAGIILPALIAALMIVLILVAREALIVLLIVISPLAFVAYLLPNTEKFFQKWMSAFWKLLMVFPIVAAVFGVSTMTSRILYNTGQTELQIIALGVTVIPFFVVPALLKGATAAVGAVGSRMQGWGNKATGRIGAKSKESYLGRQMAERKKLAAARNAQIAGGTYSGSNYLSKGRSAVAGALNRSRVTGRAGDRMADIGRALEDKEFEESVSEAATGHKTMLSSDIEDTAMGARPASEAARVAAVREIMKTGTDEQRFKLLASSKGQSERVKQSIRDGVYSKGMNSYLGGSIGDKIMRGEIGSQDDLDQAIAETAEAGKISAESLVSDGTAVNRIAKVISDSQSGARSFNLDELDSAGNVIKNADGTNKKVARKISRERIDGINKAAKTAKDTPGTKARIAGNMQGSIDLLETI